MESRVLSTASIEAMAPPASATHGVHGLDTRIERTTTAAPTETLSLSLPGGSENAIPARNWVSFIELMKRIGIIVTVLLIGCDSDSSPSAQAPSSAEAKLNVAPPGMSKYPYLAADGGPHLLLPAQAAGNWTGAPTMLAVMNPASDYGRACAAVKNKQMALIPVGSASAVVFADPPMTAWGKSADGLAEVYYLKSWTGMDLDALIAKASAALPTASLTDSGSTLQFDKPDAFLLFAGDTPSNVAYALHRVAVPVGTYKILVGSYSGQGESVTVYRLFRKPL
jgi:hypothetical protein